MQLKQETGSSSRITVKLLIKHLSNPKVEVQEDFALFLSSMPAKTFPVTVLENSVKVENEAPKDSKQMLKELLVNSVLIHLRVMYKFSDWDLESALDNLKMYFADGGFLGCPHIYHWPDHMWMMGYNCLGPAVPDNHSRKILGRFLKTITSVLAQVFFPP